MKNFFLISGAILITLSILLMHSCKKEEVPTLTTSAITNIAGTTASSGGTITSEGSGTVLARGVCWSTGTTPSIADSKTTDGAGAGSFSSNLTGLNGATVYYVRAFATNDVGTGYGMAMSFTTLGQAPTATTGAATNITTTSSTLNSTANANYLSTTVTFEYGTTINYGSSSTATQSPITGNTSTPVSADITGLTPGTTYHFRIETVNSRGTIYGSDVTFTTLGQTPTATTQAATNMTTTGATLNGSVNANLLSTIVSFEWGKTISYGDTNNATQNPVTGSSPVSISSGIIGLSPGTLYHFRIKTKNALGTVYGSDLTFTTLGLVPASITSDATNVTTTGAKLNGTVNPNELVTTVTFEYGSTSAYGASIAANPGPLTGNNITPVDASLSGLNPGTIYHFRVKSINLLGETYGVDKTILTLGNLPSSTTLEATYISVSGATLNGSVNPNYLATIVSFEWGLDTNYGSSTPSLQNEVSGNLSTSVNANIVGLVSETRYHYRVKSVNSMGTTYGLDKTFVASNSLIDIEGNVYQTKFIGTQFWMIENLKTTMLNDGTAIHLETDDWNWGMTTNPGYCWYNHDETANKNVYGALYNFYIVSSGKLCPLGWHVPTRTEWNTLFTYLDGVSVAGGKLKEAGISHWKSPNTGATNVSGFTALPGGIRTAISGNFQQINEYAVFWTADGNDSEGNAYDVKILFDSSESGIFYTKMGLGVSVRCIKDY
jgi:uncharacterized protein (TIGR02145 family)